MEYSTYPVSTRYARYEAKMQRLYRRLAWMRRHIVLVAAASAAFLAVLLWLLSFLGIFLSPLQCEDYTYGDRQSITCRTLLLRPVMEYCGDDGCWTEESPVSPGEYRLRARTKSIFGEIRYSNVPYLPGRFTSVLQESGMSTANCLSSG